MMAARHHLVAKERTTNQSNTKRDKIQIDKIQIHKRHTNEDRGEDYHSSLFDGMACDIFYSARMAELGVAGTGTVRFLAG